MRFRLLDAAKKEFPAQRLCKVLGVSPSGYFAWKKRPACRRQRDDMALLAHVRSAFALSIGTYGSPRMVHERRDNGLPIGRRRVARLMRENGMKARQKRRFKRTTDSLHAFPVVPTPPRSGLHRHGAEPEVGADISYGWTCEGWRYLAVIIDLFTRRVVGWATSDRLHKELALSALRRAVTVRRPAAGLIHHADRGSQYCAIAYQTELRKHGILVRSRNPSLTETAGDHRAANLVLQRDKRRKRDWRRYRRATPPCKDRTRRKPAFADIAPG